MKRAIITGSCGLVGSACVRYLCEKGWEVLGIDNDMRKQFFGELGSTRKMQTKLEVEYPTYEHYNVDIRERNAVRLLFAMRRPDFIIHCAAQPAHDKARDIPYDDFDVNAVGTVNMLVAAKDFAPEAPFIYTSTSKVYGDNPNRVSIVELEKRYDYAPEWKAGINEHFNTGGPDCIHSLFGAAKLSADVMCQEYGRYFRMPVGIFRGACLTGPFHAAVPLHGYLAYIVYCAVKKVPYKIIGYKGKQVRDQIHANDCALAFGAFYAVPRCGEVYNLGAGRANSLSILETLDMLESRGYKLEPEYVETPRIGDHICYISDISKLRRDYPNWEPQWDLNRIVDELVDHYSQDR